MLRPFHRIRVTSLAIAFLSIAGAASAQVREQQVAFDSARRVLVVTPAIADSVGLKSPVWPVSGVFADARLYKQDEGGYIIVVRRPDDVLERHSVSLEQLASIRAHFDGARAPVRSPPPEVVSQPSVIEPGPAEPRVESGWRSFGNGQVFLASVVYGPALASAVREGIDDPLAFYAAWFTTIGASLYLARRAQEMNVTFGQSILANHAGLHGAALGAAAAYLATGESPDSNRGAAYPAAIFAGGVGGALLGYHAGRRLTAPEAAASAFGADVGLLAAVASVSSRSRFGDNFDRSAAATLIGGTLAGYVGGSFYPRFTDDSVTVGDVISLASTGLTGILVAGAIVAAGKDSAERAANLLTAGMIAGIAVGHPLLVRRRDHTVGEAGLLLAATGGGAYLGANIGAAGGDSSAVRALVLASVGSAAAIWLMESRIKLGDPRRSSLQPPGASVHTWWPKPRLDILSGALIAAGTPGNHAVLRVRF